MERWRGFPIISRVTTSPRPSNPIGPDFLLSATTFGTISVLALCLPAKITYLWHTIRHLTKEPGHFLELPPATSHALMPGHEHGRCPVNSISRKDPELMLCHAAEHGSAWLILASRQHPQYRTRCCQYWTWLDLKLC